jgi:hypothetical protein
LLTFAVDQSKFEQSSGQQPNVGCIPKVFVE